MCLPSFRQELLRFRRVELTLNVANARSNGYSKNGTILARIITSFAKRVSRTAKGTRVLEGAGTWAG
jgi:hypothetical protein